MMENELTITNERVDDIPLLLAQMERMGIQPMLDECFPPCLPVPKADREEILDTLSDDQRWQGFETGLNQHTIRVYDLNPNRGRLDSTSAKGYWSVTGGWAVSIWAQQRSPPGLACLCYGRQVM